MSDTLCSLMLPGHGAGDERGGGTGGSTGCGALGADSEAAREAQRWEEEQQQASDHAEYMRRQIEQLRDAGTIQFTSSGVGVVVIVGVGARTADGLQAAWGNIFPRKDFSEKIFGEKICLKMFLVSIQVLFFKF